jgi:serine/threonine-protein kinase
MHRTDFPVPLTLSGEPTHADRPALTQQLESLLARWEEAREEGRDLRPEELCGLCPEMVEALRRRIAALGAPPLPETSLPPAAHPGRLSVPGYEILEELGKGGMGIVYKARQVQLKRLVALKMVRAGAWAGRHDQARFRIEAEAVAALQHANVVQIHEVGEHQGCPYMALEYVEGGSLAQRSVKPLPLRQAAQLVRDLARTMYAAHQRGIVHRDLKPANVLLTADGVPKITDFGLAKYVQQGEALAQTQSGVVLGTPSYMAPEQAAGKNSEVGPAADVYALGAILYELLTGRPPFQGATVLQTLHQVQSDEPVPPGRLQPRVPRDLEIICLKCLQKEPGRRYASADALAEDLRRFLTWEPITARPVGRAERLWRWCRLQPGRAVAVGLGLLGLAALAGVSLLALHLYQQQRHTREALARAEKDRGRLALEHGRRLCEQGDARGLLWLAKGLEWTRGDDELQKQLKEALARGCPCSGAGCPGRAVPDRIPQR